MSQHLLITGAAGNLGKAVTQQLLDHGYRLSAVLGPHDQHDFMEHERLSKESVDLLREEAAADFVRESIDRHGRLHGAVLLVGGFALGKIEKTSGEDLEKMFRLNFLTAYYLVRPLLAHLREQGGGRIILIGSRPALKADEGKNVVAYALSKSLLFRLAEMINADTDEHGVVAAVVAPGTMDNPNNRQAMPEADFSDWAPPQRVAEAIAFLLSDTGAMLREPVLKVYNRT